MHTTLLFEIGIIIANALICIGITQSFMNSVAEIIATAYTGSEKTRDMVRAQIAERWGEDEAEKYDPYTNARTYAQWIKLGYRVKKAQTALRSTTLLSAKNQKGEMIKIPRTVCLYYKLQVERV